MAIGSEPEGMLFRIVLYARWSALRIRSQLFGELASRSRRVTPDASTVVPLFSDRPEMLVDPEDDQNELGCDPRKYRPDDHAGDARQEHEEPAERADRH